MKRKRDREKERKREREKERKREREKERKREREKERKREREKERKREREKERKREREKERKREREKERKRRRKRERERERASSRRCLYQVQSVAALQVGFSSFLSMCMSHVHQRLSDHGAPEPRGGKQSLLVEITRRDSYIKPYQGSYVTGHLRLVLEAPMAWETCGFGPGTTHAHRGSSI